MIMRLPGAYPTRCRAVVHNGIVSMFAISTKKSSSLYEQTKSALAQVDTNLAEVGTIKGRILTALVFITDMAQKDDMNRAWDQWADRANPPMRACVAVELTGNSLVEIVYTALAEGFAWSGKTYPSLSKIASSITGTRWNGPKFFGLRDKPSKGARS